MRQTIARSDIIQERIQRKDERLIATPTPEELKSLTSKVTIAHGIFLAFCWLSLIAVALASIGEILILLSFAMLFMVQLTFIVGAAIHKHVARLWWWASNWMRRRMGRDFASQSRERWMSSKRSVPSEVWIETDAQGRDILHCDIGWDRASVVSEFEVERPAMEPTPWQHTKEHIKLPLVDGSIAMELFETPPEGDQPGRLGLEVRSTTTGERLALPITLPEGVDVGHLPQIDREFMDMPPSHAKALLDDLLERASALDIALSPALERLLKAKRTVVRTVGESVQVS